MKKSPNYLADVTNKQSAVDVTQKILQSDPLTFPK
jgi:hypothetical protein